MRYCIYCDRTKEESCFSKEHIIPEAIVGNLLDVPFVTYNVCRRCNIILGRYVDGKFLNSWFLKQNVAMGSYEYIDLARTKHVPLMYHGRIDGLDLPNDEECEMWMSPCRARILHVHRKATHEFGTYAAGDPITNRKFPGIALFINSSTNPQWTALGLRSFAKHFKRSKRFVANVAFQNEKDYELIGSKMDQRATEIFDSFLKQFPPGESSQRIDGRMSINFDFDQRFLCKVALGVGYNLFGNDYLYTDYCKLLRTALWEVDNVKRNQLPLLTSSYFTSEIDKIFEFFEWKGAVTLSIYPLNDSLFLFLNIYGKPLVTGIINSVGLIRSRPGILGAFGHGVIHIVIPAIGYRSKEIDILNFFVHKRKVRLNPELESLEMQRTGFDKLPPR